MADTAEQYDLVEQAEHKAPAIQYDVEGLTFAQRVALDPSIDVDRLEKIIQMERDSEAHKAEKIFNAQLAKMQPHLPSVAANGEGHNGLRYGKLEDIQSAVRPILQEYGFAVRFKVHDSENALAVECILSHEAGHSDSDRITLPFDTTGNKNAVQARGSTVSYGKRYTLCNILNIQVGGEDDDAKRSGAPLTEQQVTRIRSMLKELGGSEEVLVQWANQKGFQSTELEGLPFESFDVIEKQLSYQIKQRAKKDAG